MGRQKLHGHILASACALGSIGVSSLHASCFGNIMERKYKSQDRRWSQRVARREIRKFKHDRRQQ